MATYYKINVSGKNNKFDFVTGKEKQINEPKSFSEVQWDFETLQKAIDVINIMNPFFWKIYKGEKEDGCICVSYEENPFLKSESLIKFENKSKEDNEAFKKAQLKRAEEINKLPKKHYFQSGIDAIDKVYCMEIGKHEFRPECPHFIQGDVHIVKIEKREKVERGSFHIDNYKKGKDTLIWNIKNFVKDFADGNIPNNRKWAKEKLELLDKQFNDVKKMVRDIENKKY